MMVIADILFFSRREILHSYFIFFVHMDDIYVYGVIDL
jgi:hypothetical protein